MTVAPKPCGGCSEREKRWVSRLLLVGIRVYQRCLSPLIGQNCRFDPTCSNYALVAIEKHGVFKGMRYTVWRIMRCHPFCKGGFDPVP